MLDGIAAAVVITDLAGQVLRWNRQAEALYGFTARDMAGANVMELFVHAEDRERAGEIMAQMLAGQSWTGDFSVRTRDGGARLVRLTDTPVVVDGVPVAIIGTAFDVSEIRFEQARSADRERRLQQALQAAELGTWRWDLQTGRTMWDERLESIFGLPAGGFDGSFEMYVSLLHPDDRDRLLATVEQALADRSSYSVRHRLVRPDGAVRWIECRGQVTVVGDEVTGTIGCCWDVTDRVDAEAELAESLQAARKAAARLRLMQEVTESLAAAMDVEEIVGIVRDHVRDALGASSGSVALPDQRRRLLTLHAAYADASRTNRQFGPFPVTVDVPMTHVTRTGEALYMASPESMLTRFPAVAEMLAASTSRAVACEPIPLTNGQLNGVLVVALDHEYDWTPADQQLLKTMARQCGVALERARLLEDSRRVAERLQSGLLPQELPVITGLDVAAVYRPGGEDTEHLGGDWLDVLPLDRDRVALVIGDVMGRGIDAAAVMARMSASVRAFASVDPAPDVVLGHADRFVRREAPEIFVTVLYAVLNLADLTLTVGSAGHLPLLVLRNSTVDPVELSECPPLGLAESDRLVRVVQLQAGDALLLATDGLIERPGVDLEDALVALGQDAAQELHAGAAVGDVAEHLVRNAAPGDRDDDMTLVLAKLSTG